jgi:hypothetical protein
MFSIFKRNDAHLVGKKTFKRNKDDLFRSFESFEHAKNNLIYVKL